MNAIIMKVSRMNIRGTHCIFLFGVLILISLATGCSSDAKTMTYDVNSEITGEEKEDILGTVNDRIYEDVERGNEKEELTKLSAIYKGGKEVSVPEGRYNIFGIQAGVLTLLDENGEPWLKETLNESGVTVSLLETDIIHADAGFDNVTITKAEENNEPLFTKGIWEVGTDIDPGTYKVFIGYGHGFLEIFEEGKEPRVYEIMGNMVGETQTDIHKVITFEEGQKIRVKGSVRYEELDSDD